MSVDVPRAWEITKSGQREYHHNRCSFNVAGLLCDCDVLFKHPEQVDESRFYGAGGKVIRDNESAWNRRADKEEG